VPGQYHEARAVKWTAKKIKGEEEDRKKRTARKAGIELDVGLSTTREVRAPGRATKKRRLQNCREGGELGGGGHTRKSLNIRGKKKSVRTGTFSAGDWKRGGVRGEGLRSKRLQPMPHVE